MDLGGHGWSPKAFPFPASTAHVFCLKALLLFHNRKTVLFSLPLGMGLCGGEEHDFLISFSKRQVGKQQESMTLCSTPLMGKEGCGVAQSAPVPRGSQGGVI